MRKEPRPLEGQSRLARWREFRGWTQDELARQTGIPQRTISQMESLRNVRPNVRQYVQCALALGCDLRDVLEEEWLRWQPSPRAPAPPTRSAYGDPIGRRAVTSEVRANK